MTNIDDLIARLKADGGRYLLSVGLTNEEIRAAEQPTYGGKGHRRWLTDEEYLELCELGIGLKQMRVKLAAHEEVHTDQRRLVRELDVLLNGKEGAAPQASLCDIVSQLVTVKRTAAAPLLLELNAIKADRDELRARLWKREKQIIHLFDAIEHGDEKHRAWLREKIATHFNAAISAESKPDGPETTEVKAFIEGLEKGA